MHSTFFSNLTVKLLLVFKLRAIPLNYYPTNFVKLYHNLFTKLNHKKGCSVRHSVRASSNPRRRPHFSLPTSAHTILLGGKLIRRCKKLYGGGIFIRPRNNFPRGRGWTENSKKKFETISQCRKLSHSTENTLS